LVHFAVGSRIGERLKNESCNANAGSNIPGPWIICRAVETVNGFPAAAEGRNGRSSSPPILMVMKKRTNLWGDTFGEGFEMQQQGGLSGVCESGAKENPVARRIST
jgi:hypothetical protein